jgi:hypothetical protein
MRVRVVSRLESKRPGKVEPRGSRTLSPRIAPASRSGRKTGSKRSAEWGGSARFNTCPDGKTEPANITHESAQGRAAAQVFVNAYLPAPRR